ncbi:MAG: M15 family metallopeptidase, partial [Proteobacteria bacterium]|nr:M15 family metallopeptidase [Pseudomonadota bacterium]
MQKALLAMLQAVALLVMPAALANERPTLPDGFVYLDQAIPDLVMDMRYITEHNFVGEPIDGYRHGHAVLSAPAAAALAKVQAALRPFGLGLKVFDAYRPQRAVDHFVRWGKDLGEQRTKAHYYPDVDKQNLFKEGYIAARSSHSRGSTVDLTLISRDEKGQVHELDLGSSFDFFGPVASPHSPEV